MGAILMLAALAAAHSGQASADATVPTLNWGACPQPKPGAASTAKFLCAEAVVPVDHAAPDKGSFTLAIIKHPAEKPAERIGMKQQTALVASKSAGLDSSVDEDCTERNARRDAICAEEVTGSRCQKPSEEGLMERGTQRRGEGRYAKEHPYRNRALLVRRP